MSAVKKERGGSEVGNSLQFGCLILWFFQPTGSNFNRGKKWFDYQSNNCQLEEKECSIVEKRKIFSRHLHQIDCRSQWQWSYWWSHRRTSTHRHRERRATVSVDDRISAMVAWNRYFFKWKENLDFSRMLHASEDKPFPSRPLRLCDRGVVSGRNSIELSHI